MTTKTAAKTQKPRIDVYQVVTDRIIAALEKGVRPWQPTWATSGGGVGLPLRYNGKPYNGGNIILLWLTAMEKGYTNQRWMTFNQAKKFGGCVRKGEKSTMIFYYDIFFSKTEVDAKTKQPKKVFFVKGSPVFNVEQIDGLPERFYPKPVVLSEADAIKVKASRIAIADEYFSKIGAKRRVGSPSYSPSADIIAMPDFQSFKDAESYYATDAHEHIHWTGHKSRLNRDDFKDSRFGSDSYAMEELVAEMGSAFVCAFLGIKSDLRDDHAAYLAHWLKVLKNDKKAIFTAASAAQKATEFLHKAAGVDLVSKSDDEDDDSEDDFEEEAVAMKEAA